jgi:hypothetical protein
VYRQSRLRPRKDLFGLTAASSRAARASPRPRRFYLMMLTELRCMTVGD